MQRAIVLQAQYLLKQICQAYLLLIPGNHGMEDQIEKDQPKKVIGQRQLEQSLGGFINVHGGEGHERVDNTRSDVLLNDGHGQVHTNDNL